MKRIRSWLVLGLAMCALGAAENVKFTYLLRFSTGLDDADRHELGVVNNAVAAATILAAKHCNERNPIVLDELSPSHMAECEGLNFTFRVFDTQSEPSVAVRSYLSSYKDTHVVIGATRSACTMPVSILSSANDVPVISYWSTSEELSDESIHTTFQRTIPSDEATSAAVASLFEAYGLDYVGMLFVDDSYGNNFRDSLSTQCAKRNIQLIAESFKRKDNDSILRAVKSLAVSKLNVIFLVTFAIDAGEILQRFHEFGMYGAGKLLLFSDSLTVDVLTSIVQAHPRTADVLNGTQLLAAMGGDEGNPAYRRLRDMWQSAGVAEAKYVQQYFPGGLQFSQVSGEDAVLGSNMSSFKVDINETTFFQDTLGELDTIVPFAYDAIASACRASCQSYAQRFNITNDFRTRASPGKPLWATGKALRNIFLADEFSFQGTSGRIRFDKETGSRDPGTAYFKVRNLFVTEDKLNVLSVATATWINTSTWVLDNLRFPPGDRTAFPLAVDPPSEETNQIPDGLRIMASIFFAVIAMLNVFLFGWLMYHKHHRIVKKSQYEFLVIFLTGTTVASFSMITFFMDDKYFPTAFATGACTATLWLLSLGTTLSVAALAVKLYRIEKIFRNMTLRALLIKNTELYRAIFVILLANVGLLLLWTMLAPFEYVRNTLETDPFGYTTSSYGACSWKLGTDVFVYTFGFALLAFHLLLYIFGAVIAYRVRNFDSDFQESKFLAFAVIFQAQLYLLGAPVYIAISETEVSTKFIVYCFVVFLSNLATTLLVFVPKIFAVSSSTGEERQRGGGARPPANARQEMRKVNHQQPPPRIHLVPETKTNSSIDSSLRRKRTTSRENDVVLF